MSTIDEATKMGDKLQTQWQDMTNEADVEGNGTIDLKDFAMLMTNASITR